MNDTEGSVWERKIPVTAVYVETEDGDVVPLSEILAGLGGGGDVTILWGDIDGIPEAFPPATHTHDIDDIDGLAAALAQKADAEHTHLIADIDQLQSTVSDVIARLVALESPESEA